MKINVDSSITYTPDENFNGNDFFYYIISDGSVTKMDTARVDVIVKSINDAPLISELPGEIVLLIEDSTSFEMRNFASDVDTPYENLSWTFEPSSSAIFYSYIPITDSLIIYSNNEPGVYRFYVTLTDDSSESYSDSINIQVNLPSDLFYSNMQIPSDFFVRQNYPNPFNPVTQIEFGIPDQAEVMVDIFDITGRSINTIINQKMQAGYHTVRFRANELPSGLYFYRVRAGQYESVKRMMLLK